MSTYLLGIGTAAPANTISQTQAAHHALALSPSTKKNSGLLHALYKRSGVKSRASVLLEKHNGELSSPFFSSSSPEQNRGPNTEERMKEFESKVPLLALQASSEALKNARILPEKIRHLVTVSCTGFSAPGFDLELIRNLKLSTQVSRTHVGFMGCHGAINGFRVAHALTKAHPGESVLLCSAEISSIHFAYGWKSDQVVANSLFADGAGAAILSTYAPACRRGREDRPPWREDEGVGRIPAKPRRQGRGEAELLRRDSAGFKGPRVLTRGAPSSDGPAKSWEVFATGSAIFPNSEDAMSWRIGNHGFEMSLSARVPQLIRNHLKAWLEEWLTQQGFQLDAIKSWAVHPGGPRVLDAVELSLGLEKDQLAVSRQVLADSGNMSSATIFHILKQLYAGPAPLPCLALAFGPGLAVEAALFIRS